MKLQILKYLLNSKKSDRMITIISLLCFDSEFQVNLTIKFSNA